MGINAASTIVTFAICLASTSQLAWGDTAGQLRLQNTSISMTNGVEGTQLTAGDSVNPLETQFVGRPESFRKIPGIVMPMMKSTEDGATSKPDSGYYIIGNSRKESVAKLTRPDRQIPLDSLADLRVGTFSVTSPGARAVRVGLRISVVVDGMEVRVASKTNWETRGNAIRFPISEGGMVGMRDAFIWTPTTSGDVQIIEVSVPGEAAETTITVEDVSHLWIDPSGASPSTSRGTEKALSCNVNFTCITDPIITQAGASVARLAITTPSGQTGLCSGALINDRASSGTAWFATAHHCKITTQSVASSVQFYWRYERDCNTGTLSSAAATSIGAQLVFTEPTQSEITLLRASGPLPGGLRLLGWDPNEIGIGQLVAGIHHPDGEIKALSAGQKTGTQTISFRTGLSSSQTISAHVVNWALGVTEPGSSGSPLIKDNGAFVGVLSAGPLNATCSTATVSYYSRFSLAYPKLRAWIDPVQQVSDDWPNSAAETSTTFDSTSQRGTLESSTDQDWFRFSFAERGIWLLGGSDYQGIATNTFGRIYGGDGTTLLASNDDAPVSGFGRHFLFLNRTSPGTYFLQVTGSGGATGPYVMNSLFAPDDDHSDFFFLGTTLPFATPLVGNISRAGDADFFVIDVPVSAEVTVESNGTTDVVGFLYDSAFGQIASNDDVSYPANLNFQIKRTLAAGRYYLGVVGYDVTTRGGYSVQALSSASQPSGVNYTALWWNPAESGWGINLNHQGSIVFATLFTYDSTGRPMWLFMSNGAKQAGSESYSGQLYRATGPVFYASPFTPITSANLSEVGTMSITFASANSATLTYTVNGTPVTKQIQKQVYGSRAANCIPSTGSRAALTNYQDLWWNPAESGWGINVTHQDNTIFATLFTYGIDGKDLWFFMSGGPRQSDGSFLGDLYMASGPAFNAQPFTPITGANLTKVGTMRFRFSDGNNGTLSYVVNGAAVSKQITRQVFSSPAPSCS